MKNVWWMTAAVAVLGSTSANAACPANTVCAAEPATIITALTNAGYKAKLSKDSTGDPSIESAASGYSFEVFFYGCTKGKECKSLQFRAGWSPDDKHTAEYANKWNVAKRFTQMSVKDDTSMSLSYDVTTDGGVNKQNFADIIDWWQVMLGEASKFFAENG